VFFDGVEKVDSEYFYWEVAPCTRRMPFVCEMIHKDIGEAAFLAFSLTTILRFHD
jgi:hypothetical protein